MNDTERQIVADLIEKAQAVIDSIDPNILQESHSSYDSTLEVSEKAIWKLGTAIAIVNRDLINSEKGAIAHD